ncbi:hypothetical protein EV138_1099 [Kribbella voronezhensis]|uniref:Uncharacterized protein n=1 Tax=Kribbella voronezhensis TaxID=2512212 RepID=A0A4R7T757_9ACTN|nr:hypothetical protein EV138_1099 [Kribbella voronezhensis]
MEWHCLMGDNSGNQDTTPTLLAIVMAMFFFPGIRC